MTSVLSYHTTVTTLSAVPCILTIQTMLCAVTVKLCTVTVHCMYRRGCRGGGSAGAEPGPGHAGHQRAAAQPGRGGGLQCVGVLGVSCSSHDTEVCVVTSAANRSIGRSEVIFKKSSNHYAQLDLGVCYP